jgi:hypothetical protein
MFSLKRQVLDTAMTTLHNTVRSPKISYQSSTRYCTQEPIYIQDVVC